jgi:hypothetical protein
MNLHDVEGIHVTEDCAENAEWLEIAFLTDEGSTKITIFNKEIRDLLQGIDARSYKRDK